MKRATVGLIVCAVLATGCVDMSAVGKFAKESGAIASNKAMLDATRSQQDVRDLAADAGVPSDRIEDPASESFKAQQQVTVAALKALEGYMTVLATLSSRNTTRIGDDFSSISKSLAGLKVEDSHLKSGLAATQALANLFTSGVVKFTTRRLIRAAHEPVDQLTEYLADQAQVVAAEYDDAATLTQTAWVRLMEPTLKDTAQCRDMHVCRLAYRLARQESATAVAALEAEAAGARRARTAFLKIRKDHEALYDNVDHLTAIGVIRELQSDEPDLQNAIKGMKGS